MTRRVAVASQDGVKDGEVLRLAKVDPPPAGSRTGTLRVVRCEAIQNTVLFATVGQKLD